MWTPQTDGGMTLLERTFIETRREMKNVES
jgi:hypothetical protein